MHLQFGESLFGGVFLYLLHKKNAILAIFFYPRVYLQTAYFVVQYMCKKNSKGERNKIKPNRLSRKEQ